ncbi:MAG: 30S ribosomal protein S9 [Parcubacteria group bacterium]|nr:30S ribosomal protein S9 [Parcubacteria group bacterium]
MHAIETEEIKDKDAENRVQGTLIPKGRYVEAIGRRKRASARVRVWEEKGAKKAFVVNDREVFDYFPTEETRETAKDALAKLKIQNRFTVNAHVQGSGVSAQADAVRHGLSRALAGLDPEWRKKLKKAGFLKPDIRIVERKKFGKKKARKSPQWSKR